MNILLLLLSVLTFIAMEANANLFVVWNILPIAFVAIIYNKTDFKGVLKSSVFHMILGTILLHIFFHTVMYFDFGKAATGSSTAALGYIFFPIHSMLFGGLVYLLSKTIKLICLKLIQSG